MKKQVKQKILILLDATQLSNVWDLYCQKHRRRNLSNAHPNIYTTESMFFVNGIQQSGLIVDQMNKQNNVLGQTF